MQRIAILHDDRYQRHDTGWQHPERPERLQAIDRALVGSGVLDRCERITPHPIAEELLAERHDRAYIRRAHDACVAQLPFLDVVDSAICPESYEIALLAAGGVANAARAILQGDAAKRAFCAVRPPGHHAEYDRSMGFCLFNNVAVAADVARREFDIERVLILDWDVHHGNGTQHLFERDPDVLFVSLHGHPDHLYPGTGYAHEIGLDDGQGATLNLPFLPNAHDTEYLRAFLSQVVPKVNAFEPEFVILSAGFDAHEDDPVGNLALSCDAFVKLLGQVLEWSAKYGNGRLLSVLEGGYNLEVLERCVASHVKLLEEY